MRCHAKRTFWASLAAVAALITAPAFAQEESAGDDEVIPVMPGGPALRGLEAPPLAPPGESTTIRSGPRSLLVVLAHPDDEITIAPILARAGREGAKVTVVFATSGSAGPGVSGMEPGGELAALRESEARCAAFAMGLPEPLFWQFDDGGLGRQARAPGSAANEMAALLIDLIATEQPTTVITWGPDGGYGHADHRMVSAVVTQVIQGMGSDRPDLLYTALPAGSESALPGFDRWATTHASLITDRVRYEFVDLELTRLGIDCYQSQFDEAARSILPALLHQEIWQGTVYFRLALPSAN